MRPKVYRADRGSKLVVQDGGTIEVQAGGAIDMEGEILQSVEFSTDHFAINDGTVTLKSTVTDKLYTLDTDYFTVTEGEITLKAEVAALLEIVAAIPDTDPEQDWEVYLSEGKLVVSHDNE